MLAEKLTGGASTSTLYVDDVFAPWLRAGTGADVTTTTNIDMTKGYMLWTKGRSGATDHAIYDSARGVTYDLVSNSTAAQTTQSTGLKSVSSTGHTIGSLAKMNTSGATYVDFVFRKAPKFFDVVTYTGNGGTLSVSHALGIKPGRIIIKRTDSTGDWLVISRKSDGNIYAMYLNQTASQFYDETEGSLWGASSVSINWINSNVAAGFNTSSASYVMYVFAHDTSADGIIQAGSFTSEGSTPVDVTLGWEPQWLLVKRAVGGTGNWYLVDAMRGMPVQGMSGTGNKFLYPNLTDAEYGDYGFEPTATGFKAVNGASGNTFIYLAIRRPNKPPTTGTQVYENVAYTGNATSQRQIGSSVTMDMMLLSDRNATSTSWSTYAHYIFDRLRGDYGSLSTASTALEVAGWSNYIDFDNQVGWDTGNVTTSTDQAYFNKSGTNYVSHIFKRAPGFMDVVAYKGAGATATIPHNLTVVPGMIILKSRSLGATVWYVYHAGNTNGISSYLMLNDTRASTDTGSNLWSPTSTTFTFYLENATYIAYLFASLPGISKIGSYTGNGSSQTINCEFSAGARFILIKRTDSTGDWYVWDTVRGIVSANDPHLSLNTTAAEVTTDDSIDPGASGFVVNQVAATNINVNAASYIYLAIA